MLYKVFAHDVQDEDDNSKDRFLGTCSTGLTIRALELYADELSDTEEAIAYGVEDAKSAGAALRAVNSDAQKAAARANGAKGGRPRKLPVDR